MLTAEKLAELRAAAEMATDHIWPQTAIVLLDDIKALREALKKIALGASVMHEQDREGHLQAIARAVLEGRKDTDDAR